MGFYLGEVDNLVMVVTGSGGTGAQVYDIDENKNLEDNKNRVFRYIKQLGVSGVQVVSLNGIKYPIWSTIKRYQELRLIVEKNINELK